MEKVLIVEDDRALNDGIALSLREYDITQVHTVAQAMEIWDDGYSLIILDINLPDGNGLDICRTIRNESKIPIIFLTANDMELDIVSGLESGADDYITKPFSLAVLRARVNAVLRRQTSSENDNIFSKDEFDFDFDKMFFLIDGHSVELSKTEQKLLRILTSNIGITLQREALIDRVWGNEAQFVNSNALSVTMNRLREKLPGIPVKTVYGIGYIWEK